MHPEDRDLLVALVALRSGEIEAGSLRAAFGEWSKSDGRGMGEILVDLCAIDAERRGALEALAADPSRAWPSIRYVNKRHHRDGGVGRVSKATDEELHRDVAYKEMKDVYLDDPRKRMQFFLEAEITGGLEHPGIVPVYGLGADAQGRPFYAMKFVEGDDLEAAIDAYHWQLAKAGPGERSLALRSLLGRLIVVCQASSYAHSRGVVHMDIKPKNVFLGKFGETLLGDWGLARALGDIGTSPESGESPLLPSVGSGSNVTLSGNRYGTRGFIPPEHAAVGTVGIAGDIYALGATLYQILVGRPPIGGIEWPLFLEKVRAGDFPRPREVIPTIPRALEAICLKAVATDPACRYQAAADLAADLSCWLADEPVTAYEEPLMPRAGRWVRRHRPIVAGAAMFVVAAVAVLSGSLVVITREKQRADQNFGLTVEAVNRALVEFAGNDLLDKPYMDRPREKLTAVGSRILHELDRQSPADPKIRDTLAGIAQSLGTLQRIGGHLEQARESFTIAARLNEGLFHQYPSDDGFLEHAVAIRLERSSTSALLGDLPRAEAEALEAGDLAESMPRTSKLPFESRLALAGVRLKLGKLDEARASVEDILARLADAPRAPISDRSFAFGAEARLLQAEVAARQGRIGDAIASLQTALKDMGDFGHYLHVAAIKAIIQARLAGHLLTVGDRQHAEPLVSSSIVLLRKITRDHQDDLSFRMELAKALIVEGEVWLAPGDRRLDKARASIEEGVDLLRERADRPMDRAEVNSELGRGSALLGWIESERGNQDAAARRYEEATRAHRVATEVCPQGPLYRQRSERLAAEVRPMGGGNSHQE